MMQKAVCRQQDKTVTQRRNVGKVYEDPRGRRIGGSHQHSSSVARLEVTTACVCIKTWTNLHIGLSRVY